MVVVSDKAMPRETHFLPLLEADIKLKNVQMNMQLQIEEEIGGQGGSRGQGRGGAGR